MAFLVDKERMRLLRNLRFPASWVSRPSQHLRTLRSWVGVLQVPFLPMALAVSKGQESHGPPQFLLKGLGARKELSSLGRCPRAPGPEPQALLPTRAMFSKHLRRWGCTAVGSFVWDRISSSSSSDRK